MATQIGTTEAVLGHHLQALATGNLDEIMSDFVEESILYSPQTTFRGLAQIRGFFDFALNNLLAGESMANLKLIRQDIDAEFAYVFWSATPVVVVAGDSFCIRGGKIVMQSFAGYIPS